MNALTLHHFGVVVEDIDRAREEYVSTFGYEVLTGVVADPVQTAYVQFLRLPGDAVFLELVSPDGPRSKLANALKTDRRLNHFCFATAQLEATCASLRASGLFPLQRPVAAAAFGGRRIAWFLNKDRIPVEVVERGIPGEL